MKNMIEYMGTNLRGSKDWFMSSSANYLLSGDKKNKEYNVVISPEGWTDIWVRGDSLDGFQDDGDMESIAFAKNHVLVPKLSAKPGTTTREISILPLVAGIGNDLLVLEESLDSAILGSKILFGDRY